MSLDLAAQSKTDEYEEPLLPHEVSRNGQKRRGKGKTRTPEPPERIVHWQEPVEAWLTFLVGGHKPTTVRDYRSRLGLVRTWADGQGITLSAFNARALDQYLAYRQQIGLADTSRRHDAIVVKGFLKWAFLRKYIRSNPLLGYQIPKAQTAARYIPPADDIGKLIGAVEDCWNPFKTERAKYTFEKARRFYAARDLCIIIGILATGARISEMLGILLEDWRPDLGQISFRQTKNGEPRHLPVSALWVPYVEKYLKTRPRCDNPYLFVTADGGSFDKDGQPRPILQTTWAKAWNRYMTAAGLSGWSRHNLRHFAATHMAVDQGNLMLANAMLGHKDLKTTRIYAHNSIQQMQAPYAIADPLKSIPILVRTKKERRHKLL